MLDGIIFTIQDTYQNVNQNRSVLEEQFSFITKHPPRKYFLSGYQIVRN